MEANGLLSSNSCQAHLKWGNGFLETSPISVPSKRKRNETSVNVNGGGDCQNAFPSKESLKKRK